MDQFQAAMLRKADRLRRSKHQEATARLVGRLIKSWNGKCDRELISRVLKRCDVAGGSKIKCWNWNGASSADGYGRLKIAGRLCLPHRVMAVGFGVVADIHDAAREQCILHRCDNPKCCNPHHLSAGTLSDNMADCAAKGRLAVQKRFRATRKTGKTAEKTLQTSQQRRPGFADLSNIDNL